ncbi:MAG: hypothetical protein R6V56_04380, partial [Lentisphaeria bacterium]
MKFTLKLTAIAVIFGFFCLFTFFLWGDAFETLFDQEAIARWFRDVKSYGWLIGILLLISDIILPIPATGVMSALGYTYGFAAGWFFSTVGSLSAGLLGYGLVRIWRERVSGWLAKPEEIDRFQHAFQARGRGSNPCDRIPTGKGNEASDSVLRPSVSDCWASDAQS